MPETPKVQICNAEACAIADTQKSVHDWLLEYFNKDEICRSIWKTLKTTWEQTY